MADPITAAQFRANFTEFTSATIYPDAMINFWLGVAYKMVRACVWEDMLDVGVQLYVAHNCVLEAQAKKAAATGQAPGTIVGPANSKGVDKVSVSYDIAAGTVPGWGNWNLTTYGTRFKYYVDIFGAGGIEVGVCAPVVPYPYW